jgi:hypothetical protein
MPAEIHGNEKNNARSDSSNEQEAENLSSSNFLWTDINSFQCAREVFCDVRGSHNDHKIQ